MLSRDIHQLALAAFSRLFAKPNSTVAGVQLGAVQFRRPLDAAIRPWSISAWLSANSIRATLAKWMWRCASGASVSMDEFRKVRRKFDDAGFCLRYNLGFRDDFTDDEIARGFEMAHALG